MFFFFFKQKTAYEMRISDWSSDVCSSDLLQGLFRQFAVVGIGSTSLRSFLCDGARFRWLDRRSHFPFFIDNNSVARRWLVIRLAELECEPWNRDIGFSFFARQFGRARCCVYAIWYDWNSYPGLQNDIPN